MGTPRRLLAMRLALMSAAAVVTLAGASCGSDDEPATERPAGGGTAAADLEPIKTFLTDHTADLTAATGELKAQADGYYELAESLGFDYERLRDEKGAEVARFLKASQETWKSANPAYEEAEGIVAGVERLSQYDTILDAGSSGEDPESAVPFDLELADGEVLEQPGNFFFLTETALWGTNEDFVARGVEPDLNGDGEVTFGEALPDANFYVAAARDFDRYARELDAEAREFEPTESDVFSALVIMTPTMSEYFGQWKNSRAIAGGKASEDGFVGASRLSDITNILEGLEFAYEGIETRVAAADPQQAEQIGTSLERLRSLAERLERQEAGGRQFTPEQADTLGEEAQERAEGIAGQISQAGARLGVEVQEG